MDLGCLDRIMVEHPDTAGVAVELAAGVAGRLAPTSHAASKMAFRRLEPLEPLRKLLPEEGAEMSCKRQRSITNPSLRRT